VTQLVVFDLDETLMHATERQLPIEHLTRIEQTRASATRLKRRSGR